MENETRQQPAPTQQETPATTAPAPRKPPVPDPDWQQSSQPVFVVEDSFYRSRTPPRPVHWSIAWSDLMMTMFVLFLTLFVHQRTHQEILAHGKPNKVADETIPVQTKEEKSALVFHPISQDVTLKTSDELQEISVPPQEQTGADILIRHKTVEDQPRTEPQTSAPTPPPVALQETQSPVPEAAQETPSPAPEAVQEKTHPPPTPPQPQPEQVKTPQEPAPQTLEQSRRDEVITGIYDLSKVTLANEKLERFASIELVLDKTMRIILTGDLLFPSGQAELTPSAINSLKKVSDMVKKTPYMINVIGHTDSQPVRATRYPSNWELSLARASRVARFLIDDTQLPAGQFSVSGYSSFRPLKPNTSEENRKINRRVEIILSKELPQAEAATPANLQ